MALAAKDELTIRKVVLGAVFVSILLPVAVIGSGVAGQTMQKNTRPRARDLGLRIGILDPGPLNYITDVDGVAVGHTTIIRGDDVRTGVTAVLPHAGNLFAEKVPGAVFVAG